MDAVSRRRQQNAIILVTRLSANHDMYSLFQGDTAHFEEWDQADDVAICSLRDHVEIPYGAVSRHDGDGNAIPGILVQEYRSFVFGVDYIKCCLWYRAPFKIVVVPIQASISIDSPYPRGCLLH